MTRRALCFVIVLLFTTTFCHCQVPLYYCSFDNDLADDCGFTTTPGAPSLIVTVGESPTTNPIRPLSDITSVQSPTSPNNEPCKLPYNFSPEIWQMHFCQRYSDTNFTCPTESGTGNCVVGKYALVTPPLNVVFNHTYSIVVNNTGGAVQCLDFYCYFTSKAYNSTINVGWDDGVEPLSPMVEVTAIDDNKWQQSRITLTGMLSSNYRIVFRMINDFTFANFHYALDEIKIFDGPCDNLPITTDSTIQTTKTIINVFPDTTDQIDKTSVAPPVIQETSPSILDESTTESVSTATTRVIPLITTLVTTITSPEATGHPTTILPDGSNLTTEAPTNYTESVLTRETTTTSSYTIPSTTQSTTTTSSSPDLALVLGLSLGLGVPAVLGIIGLLVYYFKVVHSKNKVVVSSTAINEFPMTSAGDTTVNDNAVTVA